MLKNSYYKFFSNIINVFVYIFFVLTTISSLYLFTYPFSGAVKIVAFVLVAIIFCVVTFCLKSKIKSWINKILGYISKYDFKTLLIVLIVTMVLLKVIYTLFFYFDPTQSGDIGIYNDIANKILQNKTIDNGEISHLLGIGLHLALIKKLCIPLHIGLFVVMFTGTIINFLSFTKIVGKDKAFIAILLYILMPSTMVLSFCATHEVFVYLYFSIFGLLINKLLESNTWKSILYGFLLVIDSVLCVMVNPAGYILLIILALIAILSNIKVIKRIIVCLIIVFTLLSSNLINKSFDFDETQTSLNTYSILIHGSSVESNGEHVDGYPKDKALEYEIAHGMSDSSEDRLLAMKEVLKEQYVYLLSHPIEMVKLLAHKYYVYWSGDHYSLELAYSYDALSSIVYYIMLAISSGIYFVVLAIGFILYKKKEDNIEVSNYKLMLLGVVAMLLISLVLNKYSVYVTIFIYLISFYRIELDEK